MDRAPLISVVIIMQKNSHLLHLTLESLSSQEEKNFEVILMDQTGKGAQLVCCGVRVEQTGPLTLPDAMNRSLALAQGDYVQFLVPGDRFLSQQATQYIGQLAGECRMPQLIYAAFLQRDPHFPPKAMTFPLSVPLLQKGMTPTLLRCSWFLKSQLLSAGGFDPKSAYRPAFELLCRLFADQAVHAVYTKRVLTDYEWSIRPASEILGTACETCRILYKRFGLWHALRWVFFQDHVQMLRWSWKRIKEAFWRA